MERTDDYSMAGNAALRNSSMDSFTWETDMLLWGTEIAKRAILSSLNRLLRPFKGVLLQVLKKRKAPWLG